MKVLVIYDSVFGNTEQIAQAIAGKLAPLGDVRLSRAGDLSPSDLAGSDFVIVGAPTQGGRSTKPVGELLDAIPRDALKGVRVASFDTRISAADSGIGIRLLVSIIGYAAGKIAQKLKGLGGVLIAPPEGFIVKDREGPLKEGELKRASAWAESLANKIQAEDPLRE